MSFIRLSREPGFHYLSQHLAIEKSRSFDHVLEAKCGINSITEKGMAFAPLNVPLADFASFPIGSVFGNAKATVRHSPARRRSKRILLLDQGFEAWHAEKKIVIHARRPEATWMIGAPENHPVLINRGDGDRRLGITFGEQFRFVCSTVSLLLDAISLHSFAHDSPLESSFADLAESGIDEDGTLVVTPYRAYQNVSATLPIAFLISEPTLAQYLKAAFFDLNLRVGLGETAMPGEETLREPSECTIESEPTMVVKADGKRELVDLCDRIVADHRRPKFKQIVVRVKASRADDQIEMIRNLMPPEEKERERVASSTKIVRYPPSSRSPISLARFQTEFGQLFPQFGAVKIRFDREYVPSNSQRQRNQANRTDLVAPFASVAPPGGGESKIPNVKTGPTETRVFERPVVRERFLALNDDPGLVPLITDLSLVTPLMRGFLEAAYHLYDLVAHDQLPNFELARGEELLFELPARWGGFAAPDGAGRPRLIAAFPIRLDHGIVWCIEIERRHEREQFAMGLCAPIEHDDGLRFVGRVMRAVCDRVGRKRDGDLHGTFPRADFDDVYVDMVSHNEARWDGATLSQVLRSRAHHLLAPARRF
jgi:hypothetical protein